MAYYHPHSAYHHPYDSYYHPYGAYYQPYGTYYHPNSARYHPNGTPKSQKVRRSNAGFRQASGYVAAIDFGSTLCSVAYTLLGEEEILKLALDGHHTRVPNAILIERESNTVAAFGHRAQERYSRLPKRDQKKYIYFERLKMILYRARVSQCDLKSFICIMISSTGPYFWCAQFNNCDCMIVSPYISNQKV